MADNPNQLRPLASCRPANPPAWLEETKIEVRGWLIDLRATRWTMARVAAALGCSEDSLRDWRDGKVSMPVTKWKALRALHAECGGKRRVAT
jgi:hypothetical protein